MTQALDQPAQLPVGDAVHGGGRSELVLHGLVLGLLAIGRRAGSALRFLQLD